MLITRSDLGRRSLLRFAWWRMLTWLLLLLAAFGGMQYIHHAQQVWGVLQSLPAGDERSVADLHGMLGWDIGYLLAALLVIVACAGCILRQAWARSFLRVVAVVLCVWSAYRGVLLWHQWTTLNDTLSAQAVSTQMPLVTDLRHVLLISLALRLVAVPVLLWLVWQLGQPVVRLQFRSRPG